MSRIETSKVLRPLLAYSVDLTLVSEGRMGVQEMLLLSCPRSSLEMSCFPVGLQK